MSPPAFPLARRTASGIVVDERLVRVTCRWTDLASRDGERIEIEWAAQVGCVDTPADRQVLAERLLGAGDATLEASAVARLLVDDVRPTLARLVATNDSTSLLDGSRDGDVAAAIESAARRAGFAAGLRIAPPFALRVESPTVRRAQDAERARRRFDAVAVDRIARTDDVDAVAATLAGGDAASRARAVLAARHLDPLDVLRAVAGADARWSMAAPALWLAAGDLLVAVDPTRPDLSHEPIAVVGVGPIRSVRGGMIDGESRLLVGGRDGVAVVDPRGGHATTYAFPAAGDVGFNAACALAGPRTLLATHSAHGLIRWNLDDSGRPGERLGAAGAARGIAALDDGVAAFLDADGTLMIVEGDGAGPRANEATSTCFADFVPIDDRLLLTVDDAGNVEVIDPDDRPIANARVAATACTIAMIDLCGIPRAVLAAADGSLLLVDPNAGPATPLGDGRWPARVVRARPGFAALLSVDRMRVGLLDLSRPDTAIVELHVHAALGRRAADIWFA